MKQKISRSDYKIPTIVGRSQRRSSDETYFDPDTFFELGIDCKTRTLYLGSKHFNSDGCDLGIDALMADYALKGLHVLNAQDNRSPIRALLNTPGGSVHDGWAIYDAICASSAPVDIEVYGQASSMGSIILQAGRERLLRPNSVIMIHDGYMQDSERLPMRSSEAWAKWSERERERMYTLFSERSKKPKKFWSKLCRQDTIFFAEDAVKYGLADRILRPERTY